MYKCVEAIQLISFGSLCVRVVYLKQKSNGVSYSERIFVCSKNVECRHFNQFISVDASFFNRTMCVCVCACVHRDLFDIKFNSVFGFVRKLFVITD